MGFLAIEVLLRTSCALCALNADCKNMSEINAGTISVGTLEQLSETAEIQYLNSVVNNLVNLKQSNTSNSRP
jgi:hypothetical protein